MTTTEMDLPHWLKEDDPTPRDTSQASYETAVPNNEQEGHRERQYVDFQHALFREWKILLLTLSIIILMNDVPFIRIVFYPLKVFSTFIHEMCHAMASLILGGKVTKMLIFPDTSGVTYSYIPDASRLGFVFSAGYQGTAVVGFLLLIFRRTKRGPRFGILLLAMVMLVFTALWIRNTFGVVSVSLLGVLFLLVGWKLPSALMRAFYTILSVTVAMNAIGDVAILFGPMTYVNGKPTPSDASAMADVMKGTTTIMWATIWFCLAFVMTVLGVVLAIPGPNEDPAFRCCGVCMDCGLFNICNITRKDNHNNNEASEQTPILVV